MNKKFLNKKGKLQLPFLILLIFAILIILLVLVSTGWVIGQRMNQEAISAERTALPTITLATVPFTVTTDPSVTPQIPQTTKTVNPTINTSTPTLPPQCGSTKDVVTFLLIAKDYEEGNKEGGGKNDYTTGFADAIRVVRVDYRTGKVTMLAIPRDLVVSIPGLEAHSIYQERIKMAYAYGYQYDTPGQGPVLVANALATNFGFQIDYTFTMNFSAFYEMVETIGGLEIDVSEDIGQFTAGHYNMSGFQALAYARLRDKAGEDTSDVSRIERQTQIIYAIRDKALSPEILPQIPELIPQFLQLTSTDVTVGEVNHLLCLADMISDVESIEMDETYFTIQIDAFGYERYVPHYGEIRRLVEDFQLP